METDVVGMNGEPISLASMKEEVVDEIKAAAHDTEGWEKIHEEKGVTVERKNVPNSKIHIVRGRGVLKNATTDEVLSLIWPLDARKEWDDMVIEGRTLKQVDEESSVVYQSYKSPGPVINRDFVYYRVCRKNEDGSAVVSGKSVETEGVKRRGMFIRGKLLTSGSYLEPAADGGTIVHYIVQLDPCGLIPSFVANIVAVKQPLVISKLGKILEERRRNGKLSTDWNR